LIKVKAQLQQKLSDPKTGFTSYIQAVDIPYQHNFKNFYLFGAFSPITGTHFTVELPKCNGDCFQVYLDEFSKQDPTEFKIIFLDNASRD